MSNVSPTMGLPLPAWKVVSNMPAPGRDPTGMYVPGRKITFQLASGSAGSIWLPDSGLSPDAVRAAIDAEAAKIKAIDQLSSGS